MSRREMVFTVCALVFVGAFLGGALGAKPQQVAQEREAENRKTAEPARCPCADPTPEQANLDPARFLGNYGLHVCAFHIAKDDPKYQIESHHYCSAVTGGVFQCTIYDKDRGDAKLIGVEYIIGDELFQKLPTKEKAYWHPHGYEISAGLLTFTGIKEDCEKKLVKGLQKTWGKVWQTWPDPTTGVPIGEPRLMWSAAKDGDVQKELVQKRDRYYGIDVDAIRKDRRELSD
jgi:Protein of unknown function (DUF1264)